MIWWTININRVSAQWMASSARAACHSWKPHLVAACISVCRTYTWAPLPCFGSEMPKMSRKPRTFFLGWFWLNRFASLSTRCSRVASVPPPFLNSTLKPVVLNLFLVTNALFFPRKLHLFTNAYNFASVSLGSISTWKLPWACPSRCLWLLFRSLLQAETQEMLYEDIGSSGLVSGQLCLLHCKLGSNLPVPGFL